MLPIAADRSPIATDRTEPPWLPENKEHPDADFFPKTRFRALEKPKICDQRSQVLSDRAITDRTDR